jgi:hypothetical protein
MAEREPLTRQADAMRDVADGLRNIRRSVDWNAPPPRSLYAAIRRSEGLLREALGDDYPKDFVHKGRYTTLDGADPDLKSDPGAQGMLAARAEEESWCDSEGRSR